MRINSDQIAFKVANYNHLHPRQIFSEESI